MNFDLLARWWISRKPDHFENLHLSLVSIRAGVTTAQYIGKVILISLLFGILSAVVGFIIAFLLFSFNLGLQPELYNVLDLSINPSELNLPILFLIEMIFAIATFILGFICSYYALLYYPTLEKRNRETKINMGMHNAVAFMYAMRRGGAETLVIFRSLANISTIYGEISVEFRQVIRDADYFGYDLINALKHLYETTPSQKLKDFIQDLLSTIESGGDVSKYLKDRVLLYQEQAKFEQKEFLQFLGMIGEIYVTTFVAGPLFLITIMVVMGMMGSSAILELSALGYIVLPVGSLLFILMIDMVSIKDENVVSFVQAKWLHQYTDVRVEAKSGEDKFFLLLEKFDKVKTLKKWLADPTKGFIEKPERTFFFSVPIAIIYLIIICLSIPEGNIETIIDYLDDNIMIALLISMIPFGIFYTIWNKQVINIESAIPDFLDRMAGINEVGLTLTQAISIMARANLGNLGYEIKHIQRDISWGANFSDALIRFEFRVRTALVARTVTLITRAAAMSSAIGDLLRIASSDARMTEYLKRDRFSEMFIYTAIVYLAFLVFIFVIGIINTQFLSVLAEQTKSGVTMAGPLSGVGTMSLVSLDRVLYHICLVQGLFSGLIAGMMGESSLKAGVKHSCILIIIAMTVFNFIF